VNQHVRSVALGLVVAIAPLLLLDLGGTLTTAIQRDQATSVWWPVACYLATGVVVAVGVALGRRDRLIAGVAAVLVAILVLPFVPSPATTWLLELPLPRLGYGAGSAGPLLVLGAYLYAVVRGPRA
jgi:MFS family permease